MNRWLARFAMSFFVIAAVLIWEATKQMRRDPTSWRLIYYLIASAASITLGVIGTRERHRR